MAETDIILYFGPDAKPSEIAKKLEELGFKTSIGRYDFVYKWKEKPTKDDILHLADKVSGLLEGSGSTFKLETKE